VKLNREDYIAVDERLYRPAEVYELRGNFSKAEKKMGWRPTVTFEGLVKLMVENDLEKYSKCKE
jgi:GDPmannose 4,6-dehydratase